MHVVLRADAAPYQAPGHEGSCRIAPGEGRQFVNVSTEPCTVLLVTPNNP